MRKAISIALLTGMTIVSTVPMAQAGPTTGSGKKFLRGIGHLVSSPFQIPKNIIQVTSEAKPPAVAPFKGMTVGLGKGLYYFGLQFVSGLIDIVSFPHPSDPIFPPESYFPQI